jgi:hypothetical protein
MLFFGIIPYRCYLNHLNSSKIKLKLPMIISDETRPGEM